MANTNGVSTKEGHERSNNEVKDQKEDSDGNNESKNTYRLKKIENQDRKSDSDHRPPIQPWVFIADDIVL